MFVSVCVWGGGGGERERKREGKRDAHSTNWSACVPAVCVRMCPSVDVRSLPDPQSSSQN